VAAHVQTLSPASANALGAQAAPSRLFWQHQSRASAMLLGKTKVAMRTRPLFGADFLLIALLSAGLIGCAEQAQPKDQFVLKFVKA
jgi:hypothetical protein